MPDLAGRLALVPDLTGRRTGHGLAAGWFGPVLAGRDDRGNWPSDPERVQPLIGLDIAGLDRNLAPGLAGLRLLPVARLAALGPLTLGRLAPASAPPGHG
jgi:hypothetical protein